MPVWTSLPITHGGEALPVYLGEKSKEKIISVRGLNIERPYHDQGVRFCLNCFSPTARSRPPSLRSRTPCTGAPRLMAPELLLTPWV
jgi:hypothetical protein